MAKTKLIVFLAVAIIAIVLVNIAGFIMYQKSVEATNREEVKKAALEHMQNLLDKDASAFAEDFNNQFYDMDERKFLTRNDIYKDLMKQIERGGNLTSEGKVEDFIDIPNIEVLSYKDFKIKFKEMLNNTESENSTNGELSSITAALQDGGYMVILTPRVGKGTEPMVIILRKINDTWLIVLSNR